MTYRKLRDFLEAVDDDVLDQTITIRCDDEYFPSVPRFPDTDGILDNGHLVLCEQTN